MKDDRSRNDEPVAPDDDHVDPPQSDDINENEDFKPAGDEELEQDQT